MTDVLRQLAQLPDLAAEVFATIGAPNPAPPQPRVKTSREPRLPIDADRLDALHPDKGPLADLTACVRHIWEQHPDRRAELTNPPTWTSETRYLHHTYDLWADDDTPIAHHADDWLTIPETITHIHRQLTRLARTEQAPVLRLRCPQCGARMHRDRYGALGDIQLACELGHTIAAPEIAHHATQHTPMPLTAIAPTIGRDERTLRRWATAGLIHPVTDHTPTPNKPALYLPADCHRIAGMVR